MASTYTPGSIFYGGDIVPQARELEQASSTGIAGLLSPPDMFPDTNRRAAEVTAGRGIAGSSAAFGTGLRMTDEERIRRMALGQQLLSGAYARNTPLTITPAQQAAIDLQNRQLDLQRQQVNYATGRKVGDSYSQGMPNFTSFAGAGSPFNLAAGPVSPGITSYRGTKPEEVGGSTAGTIGYPGLSWDTGGGGAVPVDEAAWYELGGSPPGSLEEDFNNAQNPGGTPVDEAAWYEYGGSPSGSLEEDFNNADNPGAGGGGEDLDYWLYMMGEGG